MSNEIEMVDTLYYVRTRDADVIVIDDRLGERWILRDIPFKANSVLEAHICLQAVENDMWDEELHFFRCFLSNNEVLAICKR